MPHPVHDEDTRGWEDAIVDGMGSKHFLIIQTIVVLIWIAVNLAAWALRFDPYPFILLNLAFSTQAAYAAPLILMSGNKQEKRDRRRDDLDYEHNVTTLQLVQEVHAALHQKDTP